MNESSTVFQFSSTKVKRSSILKDGTALNFQLELHAVGLTLMMMTKCQGSPCRIFVSYASKTLPPEQYSKNFQLERIIFDINGNESKMISNIPSKKVSLKVKRLHKHFSVEKDSAVKNGTTKFELELFSTGCFYWKEANKSWSSEGCRVT